MERSLVTDDHKLTDQDIEKDSSHSANHVIENALRISGDKNSNVWTRIFGGTIDIHPQNDIKRAMQSRHLMMIAIGGTIGTGIFLSAGSAIALAGPGSALLSYFVVGVFVYSVVITLGEMAAMYPVSGAFSVFGTRFVSPALGFTLGWNYWFQCELTAAAIILQYWAPQVQPWEWALIIIIPVFAFQLIHVRVYGESEYWFALIKVLMVILFIFVGLIFDWGGVKGHPGPASTSLYYSNNIGLSNFHNSQAFIGGFQNFAQTFVYAFYSFGGIELVAIAAGESAQPYKAVPRAIKATFFRIVLFYLLTILAIGLCINWQDPTLLRAAYDSDVTASPLTVVFQRAGFGAAAHVINAVLLTAVLSATNSCFYASSRMLLSLARSGQAPRIFGWVNRRGVPIPALLASLGVSFITFLTTIWGEGIVFTWLLNLTGISALLVWGSIGAISLRFRAAYRAQGRLLSDLPYTQPLFPILPIGVVVLATLMFIAEGYSAVKEDPFDARNVVATYIGICLYIVLYVGYTVYERFGLKKTQHFVPLLEVDFDTDAVWKPGEGNTIRSQDQLERKARRIQQLEDGKSNPWRIWLTRAAKHIY
ncbi:amino acid permease-domain-containing protein [Hygrophoropsis aurantiaca]|uniref:Amino acid permease-domain-containing protein n=1 Tax=Hygrophoropsis aurantiaca TaxID=72124 RepID=A0ACB8AA35_9AGAM|nr:amino acid permease-domain-containing protein [Hygrophoropsis aurantiaca]